MEETAKTLWDYVEIIRRRKFYILTIFPIIALIGIAVVVMIPPVYMSQGVILINEQEVPTDLIRSTVTSYAEEQIQTTRQQLLTTAAIVEFIDYFDLYSEDVGHKSMSQLAERFRSNVSVDMVNANIIDPKNGRRRTANIAFTIAFEDVSPEKAEQVASKLVTLFLRENVRSRTNQATEAVRFIKEEADKIQEQLRASEDKIAKFKAQNSDSLPELLEFNRKMASDIEQQISETNKEITSLSEQVELLQIELSSLDPNPLDGNGASLNQLQQQYAALKNRYSDQHPDVIRLKAQIETLLKAGKQLDNNTPGYSGIAITNPVYRQVQFKVDSALKELDGLRATKEKLKVDLATYNERVAQTHQVKFRYDELTRDYESTLRKYQELRSKQLEAEVSESMESGSKAGSFSLLEPPSVPRTPSKPNRPKLMVMALAIAAGIAGGVVFLLEFLDPGIRGLTEVSRITGLEVLAVIPYISSTEDLQNNKRRMRILIAGLLVGLALMIALIHFWVIPLDAIFEKIVNQLG